MAVAAAVRRTWSTSNAAIAGIDAARPSSLGPPAKSPITKPAENVSSSQGSTGRSQDIDFPPPGNVVGRDGSQAGPLCGKGDGTC